MPKKRAASCKPKSKANAKAIPALVSPKTKSSIRDEKGRIKPGHSLCPGGRPAGSKTVLTEIREQIFQALEQCKKEGRPLSSLLATWLKSADAKDGGNLMRAIAAFMPKEMNLDIEARFSDLSDEALEAKISAFVKDPNVGKLLRSVE